MSRVGSPGRSSVTRAPVRIGIVGAGKVTREKHIPGFLALPGVSLVGVCNLHRESSIRVAREFNIPKIFDNWEHLVDDAGVDAVVIGTWPYMHCPITIAALANGKHVLTQARMAMNAREAQLMLDRSRASPKLTAMVVPSPLGLNGDVFIRKLMEAGYIGTLREVHVHGLSDSLADASTPIGWRQIGKYSGFNVLNLGILYETALRWTPQVRQVLARVAKLIPTRTDPATGEKVEVGTGDSVQVLTTQEDGSIGTYRLSGVVWHDTGSSVALYGSKGTLIYDLTRDEIRGARRGEPGLQVLPIPDELRRGWRVEADFVAAIRGERPVTRTDFLTAARTMQFTEAVARSARHGEAVDLPLKEFSNPSL